MDAEINMVASILRSCLITSKNGCPIDQINREYKMMEGQYIPYQKLGFQTLDAFIRVVPDIRIVKRGIDVWVEAIPTKECAHISRLVANQNRPKTRRRKMKFARPTFPRRPQPVPLYRGFRSANTANQNNRLTSFSKPQTLTTPTTQAKVTVYPPKLVIQKSIIPSQQQKPDILPTKFQNNNANKTAVSTSQNKHLDYEKNYRSTVPLYKPPGAAGLEKLHMPIKTATTTPSPMIPFTPITPTTPMTLLSSLTRTFSNTTVRRDDGPTDPRVQLERIVKSLQLPAPEYRDVPVHGKNRVGGRLYGQVLIGSQKFSSYPEEATTKTEAEILAARQALIHLRKEADAKLCPHSTTDKELMKQRVLNIIEQHNGVFTYKIPAYYEERHNENLPKDWAKEIEKWTEVTIDEGVNETTILWRRISFTDTDMVPSAMTEKEELLTSIDSAKPAPLELPEEHEWVAYVTLVNSWDEIWVRLDGESYRDTFDDMTANMIEHYESVRYPITDVVEIGAYYALLEDEYCNRVRVTDYDAATCEATIFFIDSGEEDTVSASKLLPLEEMFCWLSAQAIKVSLVGLEEFADCPSTIDELMPEIEILLLNRILCALDVNREMEDDVPVAAVVFYDVNGPDSYEVNEIIKEKIIDRLVGTSPNLEGEKSVMEINISHVAINGDVFVQVKGEGMMYLSNTLDKLISSGLSEEEINKSIVETIDQTRVYIVKCSETGNWFRGRIIDVTSETPLFLKVFLIDIGRTINVSSENILQLEILSKTLAKFPAQAIKVRLHDIKSSLFDEKTIARLVELAPPTQTLLLKVVTLDHPDSAPTVNLYKRHETDNVLIHINVALALENELSKNNDDSNNNVYKPKKRIDRVNSRTNGEQDDIGKTLKPPRIPEIGASFHVYVTMAANPSNFTVQPYKNRVALAAMMSEFQEVCLSYTGPHLSLESIQVGQFYAAQDLKGIWHRALISNIINDYMVTVHFCDYGDVTVITLDKLQPLAKQFLYLPYQAIKARLMGIHPNNVEWSPEDCERFQELVLDRDFDSIITESSPKKQSPGKTVRALKLIDVSSHEHIYIDKLLVDEGRAKNTD